MTGADVRPLILPVHPADVRRLVHGGSVVAFVTCAGLTVDDVEVFAPAPEAEIWNDMMLAEDATAQLAARVATWPLTPPT
ncbi:hypothetical protein E7T09_16280 [Deinococcus sp. KSM4-11]|uniref:hypothetical protein n=1 Tax=Deinococcus sp. KSM4-11 TaxID=2568654 RepID=UPI0010A52145|nr:hypothetical protein [Deinococcus sp. KSM4-11]THF85512.1 hypothetical protein E7T09_16280 [Deinococcus sp. KSM4-11]